MNKYGSIKLVYNLNKTTNVLSLSYHLHIIFITFTSASNWCNLRNHNHHNGYRYRRLLDSWPTYFPNASPNFTLLPVSTLNSNPEGASKIRQIVDPKLKSPTRSPLLIWMPLRFPVIIFLSKYVPGVNSLPLLVSKS